ncbi:hypothetical protein E1265_27185 [Streptomyces sp. 8K308]|uniref:hypothetical protein n=1 Tax=Streptomyces sp. 8K308 TaxID=2530388 RepID=UPI0010433CFD|nr:hypothetical protein [Streptomyces sp. 8K308]TDC15164.1 hypothetical protein E1265_27185 [Streptomyces sp. 8K308]
MTSTRARLPGGQLVGSYLAAAGLRYVTMVMKRVRPPPHTPWHPFTFIAGLRMREATYAVQEHEDGHTQWLYSRTAPGWTAAVRRGGDEIVVRQAGERRLWDELVETYAWWKELGEPAVDRFGLTVGPDGQHVVWLDEPGNIIATR